MCRQCTGTAWVDKSARRDLQFFFGSLLVPRVKRRVKRKLKEYKALRWVKRRLDQARGISRQG
jgi:hypothetical protein